MASAAFPSGKTHTTLAWLPAEVILPVAWPTAPGQVVEEAIERAFDLLMRHAG